MDNLNLVKALYAAFGRGDVPAVLNAMSPDIHWYEAENNPYMPSGEAWVGPDAVLNNLFAKLGSDFDGFAVHPKSFRVPATASSSKPATAGNTRRRAKA